MKVNEISDKQHDRGIRKDGVFQAVKYVNTHPLPWQFYYNIFHPFHIFGANNLIFHGTAENFTIFNTSFKLYSVDQIANLFERDRKLVKQELIQVARVWFDVPDITELYVTNKNYWHTTEKSAMSKYISNASDNGIDILKYRSKIQYYAKKYDKIEPVPDAWKKYTGES